MTRRRKAEPRADLPAHRTWHASLGALGNVLRDEALRDAGAWAWRQLGRGALVSCRVEPERRVLQFRVARPTRPTFGRRPQFAAEAAVFAVQLGCKDWAREIRDTESGGIEAVFTDSTPVLLGTA